MADRLQENLKFQAAKHSALGMLQNQWEFDKQLIPKALQNIGSLFPHYSRHDHSHSQQILINIERLLGNSVNNLSATDTWLLLEAAYWHDIGMVVPSKDIQDALDSNDFKQFLKIVASEPGNELCTFAKHFDTNDLSKAFSGATSPMDAVEKFRYLMAEWFRRHHPQRAQKIVGDPWKEIGLSSPRTELIPARLFTLLGQVCRMHGSTFEALLELPYRETGLANDDCHPRFIACMLRLGDLLDIDDNRFCPVMKRVAGATRPASTKAHEDKHTSIRHFRLDRDRIEITAECATVDGYVEQWRWLDWLKKEMQLQMSHWQDIAPSREFGLLPTLGKIAVHISGKQLILTDGERPQFSLDHDHVMKLFKGDNLYKREDSIRELLQNAVDATLIRIWAQQKSAINVKWQNPTDPEVKNILGASKVTATIERVQNTAATQANAATWRFTVTDEGTGISRRDLPHMLRVGGSSRNLTRRALIDSMPEWMKPSGTFGIGFQSVFLWTDVLTIQTRSFDTNESLMITLHSPTGPNRGLATIEHLETKSILSFGSTLSFEFQLPKHPRGYRYGPDNGIVYTLINKFDPLLDDELPVFPGKIAEAINRFSLDAPVLVSGEFSTNKQKIVLGQRRTEQKQLLYLEKSAVRFYAEFVQRKFNGDKVEFRGQPLDNESAPALRYANYTIDILKGDASEWLTFDRNRVQQTAERHLEELVSTALLEYVAKVGSRTIELTQIPWLSACLELMRVEHPDSKTTLLGLREQYKHKWREIPAGYTEGVAYQTIGGALSVDNCFGDKHDAPTSHYEIRKPDTELAKSNVFFLDESLVWLISQDWQTQVNRQIAYTLGPSEVLVVRLVENNNCSIFDSEVLKLALEKRAKQLGVTRVFAPCQQNGPFGKFSELILAAGTKASFSSLFPMARWTENILLPYQFLSGFRHEGISASRLDELTNWVLPNLQSASSADRIRTVYLELINFIDNDVMKDSKSWKSLRAQYGDTE